MKKILINGNMGYIGPVVVKHFRENYPNIEILGFDNGYFAGCLVDPANFPETILNHQYFGDVRDFPECILEGVDTVIQLAAISNDPMGSAFEVPTLTINYHSVIDIARLSKKYGVKNFVFASSCSVYGAAGNEAKCEDSPLNPLTTYAKSKIQCEQGLKDLADNTFNITALRFATACGFSPRLRLDLVLNDFVFNASINGKIDILSDGTPWRPLIHVRDMARAIEWASIRPLQILDPYIVVNAGSNEWNFTVYELAEKVSKEIDNVQISVNSNAVKDTRSYKVDFGLFNELAVGFTPEFTIEEAVRDLVNGINGSLREGKIQASDSRFVRLKTLNTLMDRKLINGNLIWTK